MRKLTVPSQALLPIGLIRRLPQTLSVPGRSSPKPFPVPGRSKSWELEAASWELWELAVGSCELGVVGSWLGAGGWELRWELEGTGIWRLGWEVPPCHFCCPATAVATLPNTPCHSALLPPCTAAALHSRLADSVRDLVFVESFTVETTVFYGKDCSLFEVYSKSATRSQYGHNAVTTRSLRSQRGYYAAQRGHNAVTTTQRGHNTTRSQTRSQRGHNAVTTLRGYNAVTTRKRRGHYADTMWSARSQRGHNTTRSQRTTRTQHGHNGHNAPNADTTRTQRDHNTNRSQCSYNAITTRSQHGYNTVTRLQRGHNTALLLLLPCHCCPATALPLLPCIVVSLLNHFKVMFKSS